MKIKTKVIIKDKIIPKFELFKYKIINASSKETTVTNIQIIIPENKIETNFGLNKTNAFLKESFFFSAKEIKTG